MSPISSSFFGGWGWRLLSGYHDQGNLTVYIKFLIGKNVLDRQQVLANQTDINPTVSSHFPGGAVRSCTKASTGRTNPQQRRCFPDRRCRRQQAQGQERGSEGQQAPSLQQHGTPTNSYSGCEGSRVRKVL